MIYLIAVLLALFAAIEWLHLRAIRAHTSTLTVLHAEIVALEDDVQKIVGGIKP